MSTDRTFTGIVCVYGLWHLGSVTAACLADAGFSVVGLDLDEGRIKGLADGRPPVAEPDLPELMQRSLATGLLSFTADPATALAAANVLWVAFDTPVDEDDRADAAWVRNQLEHVRGLIRPGTLVLISSQVPVGFSAQIEQAWRQTDPSLQIACSPENLRLGQAIEVFRNPERVVVGTGTGTDRARLAALFAPFSDQIEWMSLQSAEMTKHALNGFLALSVAYTNELARICERVGADASEVERGLRSEPRIGRRAYVSPGPPLAGGTLLRDVGVLGRLAAEHGIASPMVDAIRVSNHLHQDWSYIRTLHLVGDVKHPRVAVLGLTYKAGTDTLRRSASVDLARKLLDGGIQVSAYDPAVRALPLDLSGITLAASIDGALTGADVAILATAWPEFRTLSADDLARTMSQPRLIDQAGFVPHLAGDPRVIYVRVGYPLVPEGTNA
ncbi:MAG: UDP-glucose/GDP-mannose dehydrogenase family protein [Chloroflexi bacterium]|nr:UDP-glucose/GDP-mannose dehydrogenase family protein [Chloroflexota bacterium]